MEIHHPSLGIFFQKINNDYADTSLTTESVAKVCGLSPRSLNRLLKEQGYPSLSNSIINARIRAAKNLLAHSNLTLNQVAFAVGFQEYTTFFRAFKKSEGIAPSSYQ